MTTHPHFNAARLTQDVTSKSVVRIDAALLEKVGGFGESIATNVVKETPAEEPIETLK